MRAHSTTRILCTAHARTCILSAQHADMSASQGAACGGPLPAPGYSPALTGHGEAATWAQPPINTCVGFCSCAAAAGERRGAQRSRTSGRGMLDGERDATDAAPVARLYSVRSGGRPWQREQRRARSRARGSALEGPEPHWAGRAGSAVAPGERSPRRPKPIWAVILLGGSNTSAASPNSWPQMGTQALSTRRRYNQRPDIVSHLTTHTLLSTCDPGRSGVICAVAMPPRTKNGST